ncbi:MULTISPECIES: molybdenum cofactor biosynthesis protein MoaE [Flectobacillus]|jgi:molybdopterin synthase catalytic subunit|uniref:Molybdopterin synthase catalytic subunit n=2 Tax=Flectobacillus TaxID=101 RepID=A0ABT6Z1X5_9BACT|nr:MULTISPECIES: molybdenum cofactor biosynthesis protein MoaE [Flectobacillus]MDI9867277.1 molybdenum cofactor biosynthesis protein MoaE [Flectobacillus longus]MDI9875131.1 molybdenum cofactor biosynthesis protein MoaE [Flectobacillus rivi]NBA78151.1 molybdenum cofactor biosynthesis protein MoaE [Emticicia sp. ODNR4P]
MIAIADSPINIQECIDAAQSERAGAVDVFIGTVRNHNKDKSVVRLEFETYDSMAVKKMQELADEAQARWNTEKIVMVHRKGVLSIGDVAVVIAVATPHRAASFEACKWLIDTLKQVVPIWKKEVYDNGEEWLEAHA